ncbi:hypothetical protein D9615_006992 [Tricholomella constricta]|uniref:ribonuclease H n=1 Tax=Tricholomella constricta TaxID=117010 RepID=A0A8H5H8Y3_9AGAR|nr:hypothetical protein D9615_009581 [Tricholomella constricta]KAF5378805.1 hypothetical protein D9615_006992 [Tricholomella constricta]
MDPSCDALLAKNTPKSEGNVDKRAKQNIFLQSWKASSTERSGTSLDLRNLQKTAKKYNLRPEGLAFSKEIVRRRPIWYHGEAHKKIRRMNHGYISECLKGKHEVKLTGDAETLAELLNAPDHNVSNLCECQKCQYYRQVVGCPHPHECATKAKSLLDTLPAKWDPRRAPTPSNPDREDVREEIEEWTTLTRNLITGGQLGNIFRIFTEGETTGALPANLTASDTGPQLLAATDGSCMNNGQDDAYAGAGVYYAPDDERNLSAKVPAKYRQSNQTAEMLALKEAIEHAPEDGRLFLELDSKYTIQNVTSSLQRNEDEGYIKTPNADLIKLTVARIRKRKTITRVKWVKGHNGHERNEGADRKANEAANLPQNDNFDDAIEPSLRISGAKLTHITQALAYKAIRNIKAKAKPVSRMRTSNNLEKIKEAIEEEYKKRPTTEAIWKSTRRKDLSRQQRYFLWMAIHDAYMVGTHWQRDSFSAEIQSRANCSHDGATETLEHIFIKCECAGQSEVWQEMGKLWGQTNEQDWNPPSLGAALGSQIAEITNERGKLKKGRTRLYRILMAESLYLIWKLRCERIIQNDNTAHSKPEIRARWWKAINDRLEIDKQMTQKNLKNKAIPTRLVLSTWTGIIQDEQRLPDDWTGIRGVLVGHL